MATCLSPGKHHLVCDVGALITPAALTHDGQIAHFDQETGLLSWSCVQVDNAGTSTDGATLEDPVANLAPYCHAIHEWILGLEDEDIQDKYGTLLKWTSNSQLFLDCFKLVRSGHGVGASLSILLSTAALERALGDVFKLKSKNPCPAMLKHLLSTQELGETFGENAITLLRILVGPPASLNLRNLLWHGFSAPDEIPPRYSSFLLVVVASLGCLLRDRGITPGNIPHRKPLLLPQVDTESFRHILPQIHAGDLDVLLELYSSAAFFHRPMLPYCQAAVEFFKEEKYGMTVVLLLPQLENGLRKLFTVANNCPERFVSAETEYFTTFDEMLCPILSDETSNALTTIIGESHMEMLLDVLVHPEGPRLRDHISHGELDLPTIPRALAEHVLALCAAFCLRECRHQSLLQVPLLNRVRVAASEYQSLFHPVSLLKQDLLTLVGSLSLWSGLSRPDAEAVGYKTWSSTDPASGEAGDAAKSVLVMHQEVPAAREELFQSVMMPFADLDHLHKCICGLPAKTLFRPRRELEVASLLHRITCQCVAACKNIMDTAELRHQQYLAKELRSRQRANYIRLLNSIPRLSCGLRLVGLLLLCQLGGLPMIASVTHKETEALIKFLKAILRFSENLHSLTSPERNRWDECCHLTETLLQQIKNYYSKVDKTQLDQ